MKAILTVFVFYYRNSLHTSAYVISQSKWFMKVMCLSAVEIQKCVLHKLFSVLSNRLYSVVGL